ncbi:unnamed protein product [Echinostoma caproni]|uniref:Growth arrest and DNA damage-inducible proteins-interacting protein 1 n=1 Tax=Echinostoma caproni TaxID=27848 RepID=A0A183AFW0_9TREM|nr:unnamed protein product [Echinostoma caproni]
MPKSKRKIVSEQEANFTEEQKEEWNKFFRNSAEDADYVEDLKKNLAEARVKVSDEFSQYSGSLPGDLAEFKGIDELEELPEELVHHIRLLSDVLRHFRSGPLPKTVKMLPHLPGCEGLLELLKPLEWTPHVYPRVTKSEMSKTEGVILSQLIKKASLKARFASVALALTMEEEFSIPRSMVIETLLAKRYHMPEAALKRVVEYFVSFDKDCSAHFTTESRMPLSWFRSLLTFLESYHTSVDPEQRAQLIKLCRRHEHPQITPEIRQIFSVCTPKFVGLSASRAKKYYPSWHVPYILDDYQNVTRSKPNPYETWDREWKKAGISARELQPFDISHLPGHLRSRLHPNVEFFQPKYRSEMSLDYKRRLFGAYGLASGVDPATLFVEPRTVAFDQAVEQATTRPIDEVLDERRRDEQARSEATEKLMKTIKTNLAKMPELLTKFEAQRQKQLEQEAAKELKKKAIMEEARDRFGYYVSPQDPKFKKLRDELEEREKLKRKEKRKKEATQN